jgi:hypothetical protein
VPIIEVQSSLGISEARLLQSIVKLILAKDSALISLQSMFWIKASQSMILKNLDQLNIKFSLTKKEGLENMILLVVQLTNTRKLLSLQVSITIWAKELSNIMG